MPHNNNSQSTAKESKPAPQLPHRRLAELRAVLKSAANGDFTKPITIPGHADEYTELFVGIEKMREVIREQLLELRELNERLEAKAAEKSSALEEAQALTHLGSWQWDVATGTITWSDELYRIYGLQPRERDVSYDEFLRLIHPDDRDRISNIIGSSLKSKQPFEFEHRIILGNNQQRILYGMGKVMTDAAGQPVRMVGTSQDITERKKAELALRQSDERFGAVTQATHDLVYDLDLHSGSIWLNEALQSEYGYPKDRTNTTLEWWTARIHPDDALYVEDQLHQLLKTKQQTWHAEHRFQKADGSYAIVHNRAFILRDTDGEPDRIIGSFLDVTKQRQLERAKDEFISLVSHQLRTPLTIIRLFSTMLLGGMSGPLTPVQRKHARRIANASIRLIKLVSNILNISRIELGRIKIEPQPNHANRLIRDCLSELKPLVRAKAATIHFQPDTRLDLIPLDPLVFCEIVQNLVGNAIRYVPAKEGHIDVSFTKEKQGYLLAVSDNGIGIPAAAQPHIFERFYRAANAVNADGEGSGLGLYLVKLVTDSFGGKVWFKSVEGKGATFYIRIPLTGMKPHQGEQKLT